MVEAARDALAAQGVTRLELSVMAANETAMAFWPTLGFQSFRTHLARSLDEPASDRKLKLSSDETLQTLDFPASGTKTLSGRIEGYKTVAYALPVRQGQRLEVTMESPSSSAYFNIYDAKDTSGAALFAGETAGTDPALIRVNGDATYVIRPFLVRAVARRGQSANYTLKIERQ